MEADSLSTDDRFELAVAEGGLRAEHLAQEFMRTVMSG